MERIYELQIMRYYAAKGEPYMAMTNHPEDVAYIN